MYNKTKIKISSSSYIMPNSLNWKLLKDKYHVVFGEFGDWAQSLINDVDDTLVIIIFLQDLTSNEILNTKNIDDLTSHSLNHFFVALEKRLQTTDSNIIISFSSWSKTNVIYNSRNSNKLKIISNYFENRLLKLMETYSSLFSLDLDMIFGEIGYETGFDNRNYYVAHCRLSQKGIKQISFSLDKILHRIYNAPSKVLVLDCDNTIWGGVIGEVGVKGISLGSDGLGMAFQDFQRAAKKLAKDGILIALASKNNSNEVWDVFKQHNEMILKEDDIVASRINWNEKSDNLIELSNELGLGLDSFVFWDDNPLEREKMKNSLPEVKTIDVPEDVSEWPDMLRNLDSFSIFSLNNEDINKTIQYKKRNEFVSEINKAADQNIFLKSINLKPQKIDLNQDNLTRAAQLCLKTNQFNFTTIRYSLDEIEKMQKNKLSHNIFLIRLIDDFGDHGIVGLVILRKIENITILENFLLSCRVLGRKLENWVFNEILKISREMDCNQLIVKFITSPKNSVALQFLNSLNLPILSLDYFNQIEDKLTLNINDKENTILFTCDVNNFEIPDLNIFL